MADVVTEVAKGQTAWGTPEPERIINCHREVLIAKEKQMRWRRINRHLHKVYLKTTQGYQHKSVNFACERITSRLIYKVFIIRTLALVAGYHDIIAQFTNTVHCGHPKVLKLHQHTFPAHLISLSEPAVLEKWKSEPSS